ncbi:unnamed protein product [Cladocopium goreaui]|uniref:Uncharacterized protein n=1 Tax=Cladocopium goreaui TaxID=2562237 RepID=A0A9P1CDA4_9DINO|nr:unnamed protein product [Cladocopium goreaui]
MAESQHYVFESVLLGHLPDDARKAFWKHVSGLEPWKHHPVINQGSWERLVGIHIHDDGCEFYKEDEYFVWSWSSIFATAGSIKDVLMFRFPIAVIPERWMRTASVRDEVHKKIAELTAWSMEYAGRGTWPQTGFEGEEFHPKTTRFKRKGSELAKGWRACLFAFKADLKARHQMHKLKRWYKCNEFCDRCLALQGDNCPSELDYRNVGPSAAWNLTTITDETYRVLDRGSLSPWAQVPGFHFLTISHDWLHHVYLGTARDLCASGILVLIQHGRFTAEAQGASDMEEILASVHASMRKTCTEHGLYLPAKPCLTSANLGFNDGFAELGTRYKASHVKLIVWWLARETQQFADQNPQEPVLNVLATCCYSLQRVIELMDTSGFIFSVAEASEACESLKTHLKTYMWLAWYSYSRCLLLFKVRCKTHYNFHVADDIKATRLNPAMFQNFDEESFLGKLKHIGIRCHGATCVQRMFMRYLLCLAMFVREFSKKANHME